MKKIAIFAGSFDPPTLGHFDLIERTKKLDCELIVAIAQNPQKKSLFSAEEKIQMIKAHTKNVQVISFQGLLVDFAKEKNAAMLIRGLRNSFDFENELQMANANKKMGGIETIFLMTDQKYSHISSSLIKEIAIFKGPLSEFLPKDIEKAILKKMS